MAGTYAHITLVYTLCRDADLLKSIPSLKPAVKRALMMFENFCELGAVSPDLPYLTFLDKNSTGWANVMHYWTTADFIRSCIPHVYNMKYSTSEAQRCIAWLFGFTAHVVTDLTVHPIVNLKVGPYKGHELEHRLCEMNQDVYIFHEMKLGDVTNAEFIGGSGIASCIDLDNKHKLYSPIATLWGKALSSISRDSITMEAGLDKPSDDPEPDKWFHNYVLAMDKVAEEGGYLPPLLRRLAEDKGVVYPSYEEMNRGYVDNLASPGGGTINYNEVFRRAQDNVKQIWSELGQALDTGKAQSFTLANGNLDTGLIDTKSIFWGAY
jgi:hypothetical protein